MFETILSIIHVFACFFLILVVLLQQGKGGGLGAAFGASTTRQVFGGRGAGNLLTRLTAVTAAVFMTTSVVLAYIASSGDRSLRDLKIETVPPERKPAAESDPAEAACPLQSLDLAQYLSHQTIPSGWISL